MWARRIRGAIGMGLLWAICWALVGIGIGVTSLLLPWLPWDRFFRFFDAPLPTLAVPGFIGGALYSLVLGIAGRGRRFQELSLVSLAGWGALGGILLALTPATLVALGLAHLGEGTEVLDLTLILLVPLTFASTVSAAGSLLVARRAEAREELPDGSSTGVLGSGE